MKTKLAILGVGRWGKHYVRTFLHHPQTEVIAIADRNPSELTYLRQEYNLSDSVALALDWEEIRTLKQIDAVIVATPASTHYSLIEDALSLGHHVLAEKPLALDPVQCATLTHLAKQNNCQLFIDHTYLFHPALEKGKELLQSGQLGDLYYGYAARTHLGPVRQDIDVLWDLAIHDIVMFNEWLGENPYQVSARGKIWLQKERNNAATPHRQGLSDFVWASLCYPSGFEATLHFSWLNPDKQRRLCVVGSQGTLVFNEMIPHEPLSIQRGYLKQQRNKFIPEGVYYQPIYLEYREPLREVCDRFIETIATNQSYPPASGEKAQELVQILSSLSQSLEKQGEWVTVPY